MEDWHKTQDEEYLKLQKNRLASDPLTWVVQFSHIINDFLSKKSLDGDNLIKINDIGCNVGHFCRILRTIKADSQYRGYDISDSYLNIARENFANSSFFNLDIAKKAPRTCDISVISATLEHIEQHELALKNILESTNKLILLRTFFGDVNLIENCQKTLAEQSYLIKQFTKEHLELLVDKEKWSINYVEDKATSGKQKLVCNEKTILRTQQIMVLERKN